MIVAKNLNRLNATKLVDKSRFIEERMALNPAFPTPAPTLLQVAGARTTLETAITAAMDGGRTAVAIRRTRERELRLLLNQLGGYVQSIAQGNELAIRSSGFDVKRAGKPVPELEVPKDLEVAISAFTGRLDIRWAPVRNALTYHVFQTMEDPASETGWDLVGVCSKARFSVTGLSVGKTYWYRVAAIGTTGMVPISDVAHSLVR